MLCALVAAGCQSNPAPPPLESAADSSTPSPTASPAEAAPTLPAEAKGTSEAAARAFVRHYIDALNHAAATGNTSQLAALSDPDCASCTSIRRNIDDIYGADGELRGEGWILVGTRALRITRRTATLSMDMRLEPETVIRSAGAEALHNEGSRQPMTIFLTWRHGSWRVARLDLVL
jgi:hypothetical protein